MKLKSTVMSLAVLLVIGSCIAVSPSITTSAQEASSIESPENYRYYDSYQVMSLSSAEERVDFTNKEVDKHTTIGEVPLYFAQSNLANACGAVAGSILVGFYDKMFDNLVPDYVTYMSSGKYKRQDTTYVPNIINEMYTLMRTNVDDVGVSQADCLNGLKGYVENHGNRIEYSSIEKYNKFDYTTYKKSIDANKPVLMFCEEIVLKTFTSSDPTKNVIITDFPIAARHIVVGYGYYTVRYFNNQNNFRTDTYLMVAGGRGSTKSGYVNISSTEWLVDGYSVTIS